MELLSKQGADHEKGLWSTGDDDST